MELKTSLRDFLQVLFFRKNIILTLFVTISLAAFVASVLATPLYEAFTTLVIEREPPAPGLLQAQGDVTSPSLLSAGQEAAELARTQSEIIKSRVVLRKAIEALKLAPSSSEKEIESALGELQEAVAVAPVQDTIDLIRVNVQNSDPQKAADIANAVAQAYVTWYVERKKGKASGTILFIDKQLASLSRDLVEGEAQLEALKEEGGLISVEAQVGAALNRLSEFEATLQKTLGEEEETETRLNKLRAQLSNPDAAILETVKPAPNPTVELLKSKLLELELRLTSLTGTYTEESAPVLKLKREIEGIRKKLEEKMVETSLEGLPKDNPIYQGIVQGIISLQIDLEALRVRKAFLEKMLEEYRAKTVELGEREKEYKRIMRDIESKEKLFTLLQTRREEAAVAESLKEEGIATVKVLDPATPPQKPIRPNRVLNSLLGCMVGLMMGVGTASLFEYFDHSFKNVDDVERFLGLPVLAAVPKVEGRAVKRKGR